MKWSNRWDDFPKLARKYLNKQLVLKDNSQDLIPARPKYTELSNLPPLWKQARSLKFSGVLPGTSQSIAKPSWSFPIVPGAVLDPKHPSLRVGPKSFPVFKSEIFTLKAFPYAVLHPHNNATYPFPPRDPQKYRSTTCLPFGLLPLTSRKDTRNSPVIRSTMKRRVQEAIRLVVTRGASVDRIGQIVFGNPDPNAYVLKDWVYLLYPSIGLLRAPWSHLIFQVGSALAHLKKVNQEYTLEWDGPPKSAPEPTQPSTRTTFINPAINKRERESDHEVIATTLHSDRLFHSGYSESHPPGKSGTVHPRKRVQPYKPQVFLVERWLEKP
ncbi:uncharacterized protein EI90DRAFT_3010933 [Cantharellus anzutake]|uniref:uncharacterized protein n=1 Tax=Cantharellus anzutake TaxID=1750568 RepID=UPI0019042D85|nr:uncharacterized protein EI90DRAFT_3010933 [Cantharellus anzutake]KAF8344135.1 hypothetical protein EI90DRAFT_3010933 [Cantharellus anzutake]